jgi:hypothetical protein
VVGTCTDACNRPTLAQSAGLKDSYNSETGAFHRIQYSLELKDTFAETVHHIADRVAPALQCGSAVKGCGTGEYGREYGRTVQSAGSTGPARS